MTNILITGSKGQLGSEIKELSAQYKYFNFFFTDIEELDISNPNAIEDFVSSNNIHIIINCAAFTAVDKAEEDKTNALLINSTAVQNLTNTAKKYDIPFIHVSTDYVFDGNNYLPYKETDKTNPLSVYGNSKLSGEKQALKHQKSLVIRTAWLYSSFGNNFVKTIIRISENPEIKVVFDQVGSPTYARDMAVAILHIVNKIKNNEPIEYGIYHYSNEGVCSWYDFAQFIIKYIGKKTKVVPVRSEMFPRPAHRPSYSVLDKAKIKTNFGIKIPFWFDSLNDCLDKIKKD